MRIKLQHVAERAGVSEATVSRVVNARPGVSDRTRSTVLGVLAEMGYEPASLRRSDRQRTIGLVVPELDNPVFPAYSQAIEAQLAKAGCLTVLCCAGRNGSSEADYLATLVDHSIDGIVVVSGQHAMLDGAHEMYRAVSDKRIPMIFVNGAVDGLAVPSVSADEAEAARQAVRHMVDLGHRSIGFLSGPSNHLGVGRRSRGFDGAMATAGLTGNVVESTSFSVEGGRNGAHQLLAAGATGIVASSDVMALGAVRAAREVGLEVPADVSVVGYDDTDLMAFTDPPLTTVRQPVQAISDHAVDLLVNQLAGRVVASSEILVRPELVVRGSTATRRVN